MDEDRCNIDEIQALLEDEEHNGADDMDHVPKSHNENYNNTHEESDDDIDEDELDKLAALVESDMQSQPVAATKLEKTVVAKEPSSKPCVPKRSSVAEDSVAECLLSTEKVSNITKMLSPKHDKGAIALSNVNNHRECGQALSTETHVGVVEEKNTAGVFSEKAAGSAPEADVLVKLNELSAMEEQIRLMKSQLLEKAKQISPEVAAAVSSSPAASSCLTDKASDSTKPPKLRLIDEDIFKPAEIDAVCKNAQRSVKPQQTRTKQETTSVSAVTADSDSDWDDLDGEKPAVLSKEGKQLKKLLSQGTRDRTIHTPKDDPLENTTKKKPYSSTWKQRPGLSSSTSSSLSDGTSSASSAASSADIISEPLSGIRIINPLVSSVTLKSLMSGRRMIRLSRLHLKVNTPDLDSDWVTIGVMVSKTEPRKSAKGNQYSIWRLSDLDDCDKVVSLFLFNKVFQELWKTAPGTVIGLLNPTIMQSTEKSSFSDLSITIDNPKKLLILGKSKDLGRCKSKTKAGNDCINFVNCQKGDYCTYHVQIAYKKTSAKRSELQAGFTGVVPKSFEKTLFNKNSTVMYGGQTYTTGSLGGKSTKSRKKAVTIKSLQHHHVTKTSNERCKITTLDLHDLLPEDKEVLKNVKENKNEKFHDALCVPTVGSLNYVKHMMNSEKIKEKEKKKQPSFISVSAKDFLKSCEKEIQMKRTSQKRSLQSEKQEADVIFDFENAPVLPPLNLNADVIKQRAIKKIQKKGGLRKEDPNAVKKPKSPSEVDKIKKRLNKSTEDNTSDQAQPPRKKSKILGDLDLECSDIQQLIKARSKHDYELTEQEQEKQEQYFQVLEKKEQMEDKMSSISEVKCKAYICKQCKYRAMSLAPHCREQNHDIVVSDAIKKFFECKDCKQRTITIERYPHHPCRKCQGSGFVRCSMFKEKKGPKLPAEKLCLRGDEIKFLNSLN